MYGCEFMDFDPSVKINGEVGESIIESILCREGIAPRLLGVFPGGRIDEFVQSKTLDYETTKDPQIFHRIAEKLAKFHSLQIPISKKADRVQIWLKLISEIPGTKSADGQPATLCAIPLLSEHTWYEDLIKRVSGRPVFTHGDCNPNNFLVFESKKGIGKDVMIIDYDACRYFYRGYDIGYFFEMSKYKPERIDGKLKFTRVGPELSEEYKLSFLKTYLEETKKLAGHKLCPVHDSLESLQLEVELSEVYFVVCTIGWTTVLAEQVHPYTKELGKLLYPEFEEKKNQAMKRFNLWSSDLNQKCSCAN